MAGCGDCDGAVFARAGAAVLVADSRGNAAGDSCPGISTISTSFITLVAIVMGRSAWSVPAGAAVAVDGGLAVRGSARGPAVSFEQPQHGHGRYLAGNADGSQPGARRRLGRARVSAGRAEGLLAGPESERAVLCG